MAQGSIAIFTSMNNSNRLRLVSFAVMFICFILAVSWAAAAPASSTGTNSPIILLVAQIERENPGNVKTSESGTVVEMRLVGKLATDKNLILISKLASLQQLEIRGLANKSEPTKQGFAALKNLTNLISLRVCCFSNLNEGVFSEIAEMMHLRRLYLVSADVSAAEYTALRNLTNLEDLTVDYAPNFGDMELAGLTNLVHLRRLRLQFDAISPAGTNILRSIHGLNDVRVKLRSRS